MSDSTEVIVESSSPAQPAPNPPVVGAVTWNGLVASIPVTPDPNDVAGNPTTVINIRTGFRVKGDTADFTFADNPGTYPAGSAVTFTFTAPNWSVDYEFGFESGN